MIYKTLKPKFYDNFNCSGNACNFNCCTGWAINLTKNDYMRGKNAKKSPELQKIFDATYKRNKKSVNDTLYGNFIFPESKVCPFLNEDKLCAIQLECGHKVLAQTCKIFPRQATTISNSTVEYGISIGCEEVVRILMNLNSAVELVRSNENVLELMPESHTKPDRNNPVVNYYWEIKTMGLSILQSKNFSLDDKMLILGLALKKFDALQKDSKWNQIPAYAKDMISQLEGNSITELFSNLETNTNVAIKEIGQSLLQLTPKDFDVLNDIISGLGLVTKTNSETNKEELDFDINVYNKSIEKFAEFEKRHPNALENIMVNEFHTKAMPFFGGNINMWDSYIYFCYLYIIFKKSAIGYMVTNPTDDDFMHIIVRLARVFSHNPQKSTDVINGFKSQEKNTLKHMAMLMKS